MRSVRIFVSPGTYKLFLKYGIPKEQMEIIESMPVYDTKKVDNKHHMKFQKAKRRRR